jgi:hypothetical protein
LSPVIKHFFIFDLSICKVLLHSLILEKIDLLFNVSIEISFNFSEINLSVSLKNLFSFLITYGEGMVIRLLYFFLISNDTISQEFFLIFPLLFDNLKLFH